MVKQFEPISVFMMYKLFQIFLSAVYGKMLNEAFYHVVSYLHRQRAER